MSEHDTLPPDDPNAVDDDPTTPGHAAPTVPPLLTMPPVTPGLAGAPGWALRVVDEMMRTRSELSAAMSEFAEAARNLDSIATNQQLVLGEVRTLSDRVGTIERRLGLGDRRFEGIERDIAELRGRLDELERAVQSCDCRGLDG